MTESGKPAANEIIHKADMDGFVTKVDWRDDDYGIDGTIRRYYYETASGDTHPFVSSISNMDYGLDGHLIEKKALTTALVGKVNTSDVLSLEEIQATTDLTGKIPNANAVKTLDRGKLDADAVSSTFAHPHFYAIGNVGTGVSITIELTNTEQAIFVFGMGATTTCYASMIGGPQVSDYSFGKDSLTCSSKNNTHITVQLPGWFRGCMFSYLPFSVAQS